MAEPLIHILQTTDPCFPRCCRFEFCFRSSLRRYRMLWNLVWAKIWISIGLFLYKYISKSSNQSKSSLLLIYIFFCFCYILFFLLSNFAIPLPVFSIYIFYLRQWRAVTNVLGRTFTFVFAAVKFTPKKQVRVNFVRYLLSMTAALLRPFSARFRLFLHLQKYPEYRC